LIKFLLTLILVFTSRIALAEPYYQLNEAPDEKTAALFAQLSETDKELFIAKKTKYINWIEKALNVAKYSYGIGFVTKDTIEFIDEKITEKDIMPDEIRLMMEAQNYKEVPEPKLRVRERAAELNLELLSSLDKYLWANSPIIANAKEFGVALSTGLQALGGIGNKGTGGVVDVGFSITYNKEMGILAFQIFRNAEKFKSTLMPSGVAAGGWIWKAGLFWHSPNEKLTHVQGDSFYPMGVPGISTTTERSLLLGGNSGVFGFFYPPSPVGDYLTYSTSQDHKVNLRIEFSRMYTGFIRVQADLKPKAAIMNLVEFIKEVRARGKNRCDSALLTN
jgi:hypothetical protein